MSLTVVVFNLYRLVLFQLVNIAYIFISLQWNWFGPSFVLG